MADLRIRLNPTANLLDSVYKKVQRNPKTLIFAEGEDERAILASLQWRDANLGNALLVGDLEKVKKKFRELGIKESQENITIINAAISAKNDVYIEYAYKKLRRKGFLHRDCVRAVKNKRNIFASCMLSCGEGDLMITGLTRNYLSSYKSITQIIEPQSIAFALTLLIEKDKILFIADTAINISPTAKDLGNIAIHAANKVREFGYDTPRIAFISHTNFGSSTKYSYKSVSQEAVEILDSQDVDFEYEGEIGVDFALNWNLLNKTYPFHKLTNPANILIMPNLDSANISCKMMSSFTTGCTIGPILIGMSQHVQITQIDSTVSDIINLASWGAIEN